MNQLDRPRRHRTLAGASPLTALAILTVIAALAGPGAAAAQSPAVRDTAHAAPGGGEAETALQAEWAAPFAVQSVGRPLGRSLRRVFVLSEPTPAPPAAIPSPAASPTRVASAPEPKRESAREAVAGPAAPSPRRAAASRAAGTRTHRVEWGETWYGLAREYGVTPRELSAVNPDVDPEHLRSGEVIRVPRSTAHAARRTHRVVAGETLWGISRRYGVTAAELRRANRLPDDKVRIGQLLIIPQEGKR